MTDPFDALAVTDEPMYPRHDFVVALRARLARDLDTATAATAAGRSTAATAAGSATTAVQPTSLRQTSSRRPSMIPYLTVHDGPAAIDFYRAALGAVEVMRVTIDEQTGKIGHAELLIDGARVYLADEFVERGVVSPRTRGASSVAMVLDVDEIDARFAAAIAAGAEALQEPTDMPHGLRQGWLQDPFGHRWMLSQPIAASAPTAPSDDATAAGVASHGGIWAALNYADAPAGIRFAVDVLGFEAELVVPNELDPSVIEHSQLRWPEGGVVQAATANRPGNVYSARPIGTESLYVITRDPAAVYQRCVTAGVEIVQEPETPAYDPGGSVFSIRDAEGNLWSFGTYAGST